MISKAPYWGLFASVFHEKDMNQVVEAAEAKGFQHGTYSDGSFRDNVQVCFLPRKATGNDVADKVIEHVFFYARQLSLLWQVNIDTSLVESVQISKWSVGDKYGAHIDHDPSTRDLEHDRKMSMFVQLQGTGGLGIKDDGVVKCNVGDVLVFNSLVSHWAPEQVDGTRYSMVAWILGPRWE